MTHSHMVYVREPLTTADVDQLRVNLSSQVRKLSPDPVCDFCGDPHPVWRYAANRMSTGEWRACWRWLACDGCGVAIEAGEWATVESRVREKLRQMVKVFGPGASAMLTESILTKSVRAALEMFHEYVQRTDDSKGVASDN